MESEGVKLSFFLGLISKFSSVLGFLPTLLGVFLKEKLPKLFIFMPASWLSTIIWKKLFTKLKLSFLDMFSFFERRLEKSFLFTDTN